ncbi:type II toxin-antitoxin system VapC family toxin [Paracoccus benzoatiresistens]|uniref:Type II toxin-antitoxin system VapC family toxin n=1 Tax=Paracoccus benzoatiresistens TaxID=2997341 RepID=A0ABT4J1G9_9RHOB|nr:type II toxin-antitoxin system VapC family toxin [Paracoccus sp. EF6]MCZ0960966.1 type II toxin-antitoxin system VapC family toxin [Paracoccus sp. EF6]
MRLLLDTHIVLWAMADDPRLPAVLRHAIANAETLFISAATVWEVAIKSSLGKLDVPADLFDRALAAGAQPLPINWTHARAVAGLPPHHADPFDRLLIAQALAERLILVSVDRRFAAYDVALLAG